MSPQRLADPSFLSESARTCAICGQASSIKPNASVGQYAEPGERCVMSRKPAEGPLKNWADWGKAVRSSGWCSLPLGFGMAAIGCLMLLVWGAATVVVVPAVCLFVGFALILGLRSLVYVQSVEPQYWQVRPPPPHCCPTCGYDLTANVSGVCPECGTACGAGQEASREETRQPETRQERDRTPAKRRA